MKRLSLIDITLLAIAICLILILLPVLIRLRQSTTLEKEAQRVQNRVTTTTLPDAIPNEQHLKESLPVTKDGAEDEKIPRPAKGEKPILMY